MQSTVKNKFETVSEKRKINLSGEYTNTLSKSGRLLEFLHFLKVSKRTPSQAFIFFYLLCLKYKIEANFIRTLKRNLLSE